MHDKFRDAGYKIFGLHGIRKDGACACGNPDCHAAGKHPLRRGWQNTKRYNDDQYQALVDAGEFKTGYGVLVDGLLVIDVDARNGGIESYSRLVVDVPDIAGCGLIVETGSGGGSKHLYFRLGDGALLSQTARKYPGIDFKSSGYVVGPGSIHSSGNKYLAVVGDPYEISEAPKELVDLLWINRAGAGGADVVGSGNDGEIDGASVAEMLSFIDPDCDYDIWIKCGMAIHHATGGGADGLELWDKWSEGGSKYKPGEIESKWLSFGKSGEVVTIGTLAHIAESCGYERQVEFTPSVYFDVPDTNAWELPFDSSEIDLERPPGLVGKITEWINRTSRYERRKLAVLAALSAVGNIGGLRYRDDISGVTTNLLSVCIAGTGTGKEHVMNCYAQIMRSAGMGATIHGDIKSKQEIMRNLIEHQAANYCVDEFGEVLRVINGAKGGGASYLDSVIKEIMSLYTKADGVAQISGDVRREVKKLIENEIAYCNKKIDDNEDRSGRFKSRAEKLIYRLNDLVSTGGIRRPFLSLIGLTTMETFIGSVTVDMVKNGFLNRTIVVSEPETNPAPQKPARDEFPYDMQMLAIADNGVYDGSSDRIEYYGEPELISTSGDARAMLDDILQWQHSFAEWHKQNTGYESLARRAYEFISKISTILAIADGGERTLQHVKWAAAYIYQDITYKVSLVKTAVGMEHGASKEDVFESLKERAVNYCSDNGEVYEKRLIFLLRRKGIDSSRIKEFVDKLVKDGVLYRSGKKVRLAV